MEIPKAITQTLEGVDRVATIVRAMKDFSHPGKKERIPIDIHKAIESTLVVCRHEYKYVADLATDFDASMPAVTCFPGDFNQVIMNLVINAAHAIAGNLDSQTNSKGKISITTRRDGNWAEIRISDTGSGIPEDIRTKIYDPFFTTKEVGKGTGQGLAICHAVVVGMHRGTITFDTQEGKGTTFIIRLPLDGSRQQSETA
jgi:signal transduction histidine kinase